jgi:small-conductance mechanosensitive channel
MDITTKDFLKELSDKLGVTADKVYACMLKQVKIDAIMGVVFQILGTIVLYIIYRLWLVWMPLFVPLNPQAAFYEQDYPVPVFVSGIMLGIFSLLAIIWFVTSIGDCISDMVNAIVNPEAEAIKKISYLVKK